MENGGRSGGWIGSCQERQGPCIIENPGVHREKEGHGTGRGRCRPLTSCANGAVDLEDTHAYSGTPVVQYVGQGEPRSAVIGGAMREGIGRHYFAQNLDPRNGRLILFWDWLTLGGVPDRPPTTDRITNRRS